MTERQFDEVESLAPTFSRIRNRKKLTVEQQKALFFSGWSVMRETILESLDNLEVLMIEELNFIFELKCRTNSLPLRFLTTSLKVIHVWLPSEQNLIHSLSARNAIFILVFCPSIQECSLGFHLAIEDYRYLADHLPGFRGLSKVKNLAIRFQFFSSESEKKFWNAAETETGNLSRWDRPTLARWNFLQVTRDLDALEICQQSSTTNRTVSPDCLSGLNLSFKSLKHLRLLMAENPLTKPSFDYRCFQKLTTFSTEWFWLKRLGSHLPILLPNNLKTFCLVFYRFSSDGNRDPQDQSNEIPLTVHQEDILLIRLLQSVHLPSLKEVVVPQEFVDVGGEIVTSLEARAIWSQQRKSLEEETSKRGIKLTLLKPGESGKSLAIVVVVSGSEDSKLNHLV